MQKSGPEQSMKIDDRKINRSINDNRLLLISIDWHRPIDDQSIITLRGSQTSLIAIDWHKIHVSVFSAIAGVYADCILFLNLSSKV